jgi:hypothetical protein
MASDLKLALAAINNKTTDYDILYGYYDGEPSLKYSTERLQRAFDSSFVYFAQNWASVIINAVLDRLVLKGFDLQEDSLNSRVDDLYTKLNLNLEAQDVHEALQVTGEAFLFVDQIDGEIDVYFNDPRMCEMFYNPDRPKIKSYAAKKWLASDGLYHLNLYYPDRTEKYTSKSGSTPASFTLVETTPNETGVIPVFHFKNSRRIIKGELDSSALSELDAINKLFSDLMVAAEFETFKTKIFISQVDPGEVNIGPDMKMWIPARESEGENTQVIELGGADLERFLKPINEIATSLAIQTRTPRHYFMNTGSNVSGEALIVEESALVKKVIKKQEAYSPEWQAIISYILSLQGIEVEPSVIVPVWDNVESKQPLTEAMVIKTEHDAGIPVVNSFRRRGAGEDEIAQLEEDIKQDDSRKQETLATSMMNFNRE